MKRFGRERRRALARLSAEARPIIQKAAERYRVNPRDLVGQSRERRFVVARREAAMELRLRSWSLQQIGKVLGGRDHTTIKHMLGQVTPQGEIELSLELLVPDYSGEWAI